MKEAVPRENVVVGHADGLVRDMRFVRMTIEMDQVISGSDVGDRGERGTDRERAQPSLSRCLVRHAFSLQQG